MEKVLAALGGIAVVGTVIVVAIVVAASVAVKRGWNPFR